MDVGQISSGPPNLQRLIEESRGVAKETKRATPTPRGTIYFQDVVNWIQKQEYDPYTEKELIRVASNYPQGGLNRFFSTLNSHINSIQRARRQEAGRETKYKPEIDINTLSEEKRRSALKQRMLGRLRFEEEQRALKELQKQEEIKEQKREEIRQMFVPPTEVQAPPERPQPQFQPQYKQPQVPEQKRIEPRPQPQPQQSPPQDQSDVLKSMDLRRKFAQRLSEITQEEEITDQEWLRDG